MGSHRTVENYSGVAIGRASEDGEVRDFAGVHIGRLAGDGLVVDHAGVRIGRLHAEERQPSGTAGPR